MKTTDMLYEFLQSERKEILTLCAEKILAITNTKESSNKIDRELSIFYDELIEVLCIDATKSKEASTKTNETIHNSSAIRRGKESLKLGYSISQVVHSYGAICQGITQYLEKRIGNTTSAREFNRLNLCLDSAIAEAVTEFSRAQQQNTTHDEAQRLGFLAHELRNALTHATIAYRMIKAGKVGPNGNTAKLLEDAHTRMRNVIDRTLAEVRLESETQLKFQKYRVLDLISEVEISTSFEASEKSIEIFIKSDPTLEVLIDHHLIISALSNLVQNAIKFTKVSGIVWIRAIKKEDRVVIEVEDQCGGLPSGKAEELFQPFNQQGKDRSGLGLGLTIARRSVTSNNGTLQVMNIPDQGCIFSINLPIA